MNTTQPDALRLADWCDEHSSGIYRPSAQAAAELRRLHAENEKLSALGERLKQEAHIHAQEARTANATIAEIYQCVSGATGEPGNWHGAEPVRKHIADLEAQLASIGAGGEGSLMGAAVHAYFMRQVVAVAVTALFDTHEEDVLRVFRLPELREIVRISEPLRPQQMEDIYKKAWDALSPPSSAQREVSNGL